MRFIRVFTCENDDSHCPNPLKPDLAVERKAHCFRRSNIPIVPVAYFVFTGICRVLRSESAKMRLYLRAQYLSSAACSLDSLSGCGLHILHPHVTARRSLVICSVLASVSTLDTRCTFVFVCFGALLTSSSPAYFKFCDPNLRRPSAIRVIRRLLSSHSQSACDGHLRRSLVICSILACVYS